MSSATRHTRWAHFRFSVIGPLLASPPRNGELRAALDALAEATYQHPITGAPARFGRSTIERWYYTAQRSARDPVRDLRRKVRSDAGRQRSLTHELRAALRAQHAAHPSWSATLHTDNLVALVKARPELGAVPSASTIRRYLRAQGLERTRRRRGASAKPLQSREVRSYEAPYVHGLWHADFHHGSLRVLEPDGRWHTPILMGALDDASRVAVHLQWYLDETARSFVHGLMQAIQKWGLPRALLTDNGAAMLAAETREGLLRLGIVHETTLPYSPHQNAKQEIFWEKVEGRLCAMLEGVGDLTLDLLNEATQAWLVGDVHNAHHRELGCSPLERFRRGPDVGRESPDSETLRRAFRAEVTRTQRRSDGTISVDGRRFEVPARYRTLPKLRVRYARWDLSTVDLIDPTSDTVLCALYPLDKHRNADRARSPLSDVDREGADVPEEAGMAPLLRKLLADYAATGRPPAYLPVQKDEDTDE